MSESEQRSAFLEWVASASATSHLFTQVSTDGGKTWGWQCDPNKVAWEAWKAATEHAKQTGESQ